MLGQMNSFGLGHLSYKDIFSVDFFAVISIINLGDFPMTALKLFLLRPLRVELDGALVEIRCRKAFALLIYLAVTEQPHSRNTLATLFYPDQNQNRSRS